MKVIIFGASGGIGKWAVKHALEKGYEVTAYVRNPDKMTAKHEKLTVVKGEISDYDTMRDAVQGQDAVIWCVGIPMKKYEKMESLPGHENLIRAMDECRVKRLIDWSTTSTPSEKDKKSFWTVVPPIMVGITMPTAKKELIGISDLLKKSDLDWTIVRFLAPNDKPATGKVVTGYGGTKMKIAIPREDIGVFMVEQVESAKYLRDMPLIGT